jgi:periplasmic divalent cation tolerance protein
MTDAVVVLMTAPSEEVAVAVARKLVEERLLACANLVPRIRSIYRWEGQIHDEAEVLLVGKTTVPALDALKARLPQLHPYQTPELLAVRVVAGAEKYLAWLTESVGP